MKDVKIVFFGTHNFSKGILESLIINQYNVIGVVSQPDKPVGRKHEIKPTPVKELALKHNIPVYQPVKLRAESSMIVDLKPDLIIAPIGKDKCDSGWFASKILADMGFNVIQTIFEKLEPKRELKISTSNLPLYDKITMITDNIITPTNHENIVQVPAEFGFWGVPPNDLEILKL